MCPVEPATDQEKGGADDSLEGAERALPLGKAVLAAPYIPDFPFEEVQFWFSPNRAHPREVYHELLGRSADKWESYYNKKGWRFANQLMPSERGAEGPFRAAPGELRPRILESGRLFAPRPQLELPGGEGSPRVSLPVVSLDKRRPLNPWKPTYIKALNFIKKYEWPKELPAVAQSAIWEIEECGEIAGSTSWQNSVMLLEDNMSEDLRTTLADLFERRPEEFPLGSSLYLRILGTSGPEGFAMLADLHKHPSFRKRKHVAAALGKLGRPDGLSPLFALLDDEDPEVRTTALRALGQVGVPAEEVRAENVRRCLEATEISHRVWAAQALVKGGDESQRKFLIALVKDEEGKVLADMGELGEVLANLDLVEVVPYLIQRLKSEKSEIRADAAEVLRIMTGLALDLPPGDEEARRQAIRAATRWWDESKKERRRAGAGKE